MTDPANDPQTLPDKLLPVIMALLVAAPGIALFYLLGFPLPWLLGTIFPLLIVSSKTSLRLEPPKLLVHPARGMLGIAIGASFTPALFDSIDVYLVSLAVLIPFVMVMIWAGKQYYQRVAGLDGSTALFCSMPGGLLEMSLLCESYGARLKNVVIAHTTRVLLIVYTIPFLIQWTTDYDLSGRVRDLPPPVASDIPEYGILLVAAIAGWWLFKKLRMTGASIVGPMLFCAALYLLGWVQLPIHDFFINMAQLILGIRIGLSVRDLTLKEFSQHLVYAIGFFLLIIAMSLLAAVGVSHVTGIEFIATFLAYVPGGQAEMNIIAIIIGAHVPYIALHHVVRMFFVVGMATQIERLFR